MSTIAAVATALTGAVTLPVCAQAVAPPAVSASPAAQAQVPPPESLYADAAAKETAVRKALTSNEPLPTLLKAVRTVVSDYENVVRHYPTSSYADDSLWRAAKLSRDAFEAFSESRERAVALRLFKFLASQYPSSRLAKAAPDQIAWLNTHQARTVTPPPTTPAAEPTTTTTRTASTTGPAGTTPSAAGATAARTPLASAPATTAATTAADTTATTKLVTVKAIRRAVMKDLVRVVIELDDEVAFHDERLENPQRVFLDLPSTTTAPALVDRTLRFDADTDIVRQVRVGRQPRNTTRVVIEAAGMSSYSVYPLYSPFRLIVDCVREAPLRAAVTTPPTPGSNIAAAAAKPSTPAQVSPTVGPTVPPVAAAVAPASTAPVAPTASAPVPAAVVVPATVPAGALAQTAGVVATAVTTSAAAASTSAAAAAAPSRSSAATGAGVRSTTPPARNMDGGLSMARQLGLGVSRIVIDPGHGGHDPGARGPNGTEAELVLDIALRLEKLLSKLPGVDVVLTRRDDEFIPLQERTAIANRQGADLFLSIHANASSVPAARGVETYFLNFASNQTAAAVAARENATSGQTMGALQDVVKMIALNSKLDESRDFATYVQREMLESIRGANKAVKDLGVKQAPFVVLIGAAMPSVLAEVSFITNPQEAKLLKGGGYRQRIAQALFEGIKAYQASLKRAPAMAQQD